MKNAARLAAALQPAGFRIVSGGTDNHIVLVDVFSKGITGKVAEAALGQAGITVNKNAIPFDQNPPMVASGIRLGTPAVTTRGMGEAEMDLIAEFITRVHGVARRRRRARDGQGRSRSSCAGSSRCTRNAWPEAPRSTRRLPTTARWRARSISSSRARVSARWPLRSASTLQHGGVLLAEAGTGTGKTLAYLVPAILNRQRVLISTGTKNLQEQIYFKDIPALRTALGVPFTRHLHEGPRQLPVPASSRSAARAPGCAAWISSR